MATRRAVGEHRPPRCRLCLALVLSALGPVRASLAADAEPARPAAVSGDGQLLWIVAADWDGDDQQYLNWIAWMDPASLSIYPLRLPAQLGEIRAAATLQGRLHLFLFSPGRDAMKTAHYAYTKSGEARRQLRLPGDALPLALAADQALLWALVDGKTAHRIQEEWQDYQSSLQTLPAEEPGEPSAAGEGSERFAGSRPSDVSPNGCHLVTYDGAQWRPAFEGPEGPRSDAAAWLVLDGHRQHVFWSAAPGSGEVNYARRESDAWRRGPELRFAQRVAHGFAGRLNRQLVFAALTSEHEGGPVDCVVKILPPGVEAWDERPPLEPADGKTVSFPKGSVLGGSRENLVLLAPSREGARIGLWSPADGRLVKGFVEVPIRRAPVGALPSSRAGDIVPLVLVVVVILLVYWLRQDSLAAPILVPPGPTAAALGRRALAAVIDLAPAAAIVLVVWWSPITTYLTELRAAMEVVDQPAPSPAPLMWPWFTALVLYSAYCTVFELLRSATPGKRLLGCLVMSERLEKPTPLQIVVRNASRLLELEPHLNVWPFLLVMFMTRNRQRVGDMLARTLVVQPGQGVNQEDEAPVSRREESSAQRGSRNGD